MSDTDLRYWVSPTYPPGPPHVTPFTVAGECAQDRILYIKERYSCVPDSMRRHREAHYDTGGILWMGHPLAKLYLSGGRVLTCFLRDLDILRTFPHTIKDGLVRLSSAYGMILVTPEVMEEIRNTRNLRYYQRANSTSRKRYRISEAAAVAAALQGHGKWEPPKGYKGRRSSG